MVGGRLFLGLRGSSNARYVSLAFVPRTGSVSFFIVMWPPEASPLLITHFLDTQRRANEFSNFTSGRRSDGRRDTLRSSNSVYRTFYLGFRISSKKKYFTITRRSAAPRFLNSEVHCDARENFVCMGASRHVLSPDFSLAYSVSSELSSIYLEGYFTRYYYSRSHAY